MKKVFEMEFMGSTREELIEARDAAVAYVLRNPSIKAFRNLECGIVLDNGYSKVIIESGCDDGSHSWCNKVIDADKWVEAVNRELISSVAIDKFNISAKVEYTK